MPQAPNIDGLPLWLQITMSLIFVIATGGAALFGYRSRLEREPYGAAQTVLAAFPDMGAIRQLTDQSRVLCEHMERLDSTMRDQVHYMRNKIEMEAELCQRLRELKEELGRADR